MSAHNANKKLAWHLILFSWGKSPKHLLPCKLPATNSDPRQHTVVAQNSGVVFVSSAIIVMLNTRVVLIIRTPLKY